MAEQQKGKAAVSYPHRGHADSSWPICGICEGHGAITPEVAIALAGKGTPIAKGGPCPACNGVGRVPDASWATCPEPCRTDEGCSGLGYVCGGLGLLSPERQLALDNGEIRVPCYRCEGTGVLPYRPRPEPQPRT